MLIFLTAHGLLADISLPKIFSDRMVLQHGTSVRVWGSADANEELTITLGDKSAKTKANANGDWDVAIQPPDIGGPYELGVEGKESKVVVSDVMVGEVWLCAGESNMHLSIRQSMEFETDEAADEFFNEIIHPNLRLFTVPASSTEEPAEEFSEAVTWQECNGENLQQFSALAYHFAIALRQNERLKDVPIGLIDCSWGGTPAEAWISNETLQGQEELKPLLDHWNENTDGQGPSQPSSLFNGMIAPVAPMTIRGVLWYQGEANIGRGSQYGVLLPTLIQDWRKHFEIGDFPFYFVQLAPRRYENHDQRALPEVWDSQLKSLSVPNTGMVGSSDIGNSEELRPQNKQVIGQRLATLALAETYGEVEMVFSGPVFESAEVGQDGKSIEVQFLHAEGLKSEQPELTGFMISNQEGEFFPAEAKIEGDKVLSLIHI